MDFGRCCVRIPRLKDVVNRIIISTMNSRTVALVALFLAVLTAPWVLWIYVPAPGGWTLWFLAAFLGEFNFILASIALVALVLSVIAWSSGVRVLPLVSGLLALGTLVGALIPVAQVYSTARAEGLRLSLPEYVAGLTTTPSLAPRTETYAVVEGKPLKLDIWELPRASPTPRIPPAVILVHGGAWTSGTRSEAPLWDSWLSEQGFIVFDIDYRLAPPARWQDAPGDVKCAVGWVKRHAAGLGVDPNRITLLGVSSGGHLALLAAYTAGDERLSPSCPVEDPSVAAVIAFAAPTDLAWMYNAPLPWWYPEALASTESLEAFTGGTPETAPDAYRLGSPLHHAKAGLPPTLLVHGERDQLVFSEESERLAARLVEAGVEHRFVRLSYANHLFDLNWGGWGSQLTRQVLVDFLDEYVR